MEKNVINFKRKINHKYGGKTMLNLEQQVDFEKRYPDAQAYRVHCELLNEYRVLLRRDPDLNTWESRRLEELSNLQLNDR